MAYQQMTIIASVCISTNSWNFQQDKKEADLKLKLETMLDKHLQEVHERPVGDVGVLDVDFEYGEQI